MWATGAASPTWPIALARTCERDLDAALLVDQALVIHGAVLAGTAPSLDRAEHARRTGRRARSKVWLIVWLEISSKPTTTGTSTRDSRSRISSGRTSEVALGVEVGLVHRFIGVVWIRAGRTGASVLVKTARRRSAVDVVRQFHALIGLSTSRMSFKRTISAARQWPACRLLGAVRVRLKSRSSTSRPSAAPP